MSVSRLVALAATLSAIAYGDVVPMSGNHSASTLPFWESYTYCQGEYRVLVKTAAMRVLTWSLGRIVEPNSTWQPLENATMVKLQVM